MSNPANQASQPVKAEPAVQNEPTVASAEPQQAAAAAEVQSTVAPAPEPVVESAPAAAPAAAMTEQATAEQAVAPAQAQVQTQAQAPADVTTQAPAAAAPDAAAPAEAPAQAQAQPQPQTQAKPNADDFLANIGKKVSFEALKSGSKWAILNFWTYYIIVNLFVASIFLFKAKSVEAFSLVLVLGFGGSLFSLLRSKYLVSKEVGAVKIGPNDPEYGQLYDLVDYLAYKAKLPKTPEVAIYPSADMNAFAVGASQSSAMVAFSTALLQKMPMEEVAAVAAHEIGHIVSRDMMGTSLIKGSVRFTALVITFPLWCIKFFIWFYIREQSWLKVCDFCIKVVTGCVNAVGWLIERAFSRHREYRADRTAAMLTSPAHMQMALARLASDVDTPLAHQPSLDCYRISGRINFFEWFSTHPTIEHRVERLAQEQHLTAGGMPEGAPSAQNMAPDQAVISGQNVQINQAQNLNHGDDSTSIVAESQKFQEAKLAAIAAGAVGFGLGMAMADDAVAAEQAAPEAATEPAPQAQAAAPQDTAAQAHAPKDSHSQGASEESAESSPLEDTVESAISEKVSSYIEPQNYDDEEDEAEDDDDDGSFFDFEED